MRLHPLALATCLFAAACGGADEPADEPTSPEPAPADPAPAPEPEPAAEPDAPEDVDLAAMSSDEQKSWLMTKGEEVYKTGGSSGVACVTCHMDNGQGVPGAFPPLAGATDFMSDCVTHAGFVVDGLSGEIVVNGTTYNGVMPPQPTLSDVEIAAVITYERNSWGNSASVCLPEQVAEAR